MIGIVKVLLPFVALFVAIYFMLYKRSRNNKRVHFLFPVQLFLALMSFGISVCWFTTGQEFLYNYGNFWDMVERGTLDSLSSVTGTIGVSCLFFGWTYSEREKVTLGYRQIDIVRYKYGFGYGLSIFIHFSATVLCSILLKCKAREAALWTFLTIVYGCVPQVLIFLRIVINKENREKIALDQWCYEAEEASEKIYILQNMTKHLSDINVYHNTEYRNTLGYVFSQWLISCVKRDQTRYGITVKNVKSASTIFKEIAERIPQKEQLLFEENILKFVCSAFPKKISKYKSAALTLLCVGYIRYLYLLDSKSINFRIQRIVYYVQQENNAYREFGIMLKALTNGLEWYHFITQRRDVPDSVVTCDSINSYINDAFIQLIVSIFEDDKQVERNAKIAWHQAYGGGTFE